MHLSCTTVCLNARLTIENGWIALRSSVKLFAAKTDDMRVAMALTASAIRMMHADSK